MSLRDLFVILLVFGSLPWILVRPYVGIIMWCWISYMNPHRLTWGIAYNFPFAYIVAIITLIGLLFSKEPKRIPVTGLTILWLVFILWMCITTVYAMFPDAAYEQLIKVLKIQLMTFVTIMLMRTKERINMLVWIIVLSLGYFGFKGGIFTLLTGGEFRVWGPPASFVEDNNALALALLMILPLMIYLRNYSENKWVRRGLLISIFLISVSVVGSYSRAALIGGLSVASFIWIKSKNKVGSAIAVALLIPFLFFFMPQAWHDRMTSTYTTSEEGQHEGSAQARIETWKMIFNLAAHRPILGAGFEPWNTLTVQLYSDNPEEVGVHAAHSIYMSPLAEHGWPGLGMFVSILIIAWRTGSWIIRQCRGHPELEWLANLISMVQLGLIAYCSGGTFHSLTYFDLPWHMISIIVIGKALVQKYAKETEQVKSLPQRWIDPLQEANSATTGR